jgi:antitoxin CcdA
MTLGKRVGRIKVNLTLDAEVAKAARALGLNMSRLAEAAIEEAARIERNRLWQDKNRAAIEAYEAEVARDGLPLAEFRSF